MALKKVAFLVVAAWLLPAGDAGDPAPTDPPDLVEVDLERTEAWSGLAGDGGEDCVPDCDGRECGGDGCSGSCGLCPSGFTCGPGGACVPGAAQPGTCAHGGCFVNCSVTDDACLSACVSKLDNDAQTHAWDLKECATETCADCIPASGSLTPTAFICWAECLRESCVIPYSECLTGQGGCWGLGGCVKGCADADVQCSMGCYAEATLDSQEAFLNLTKCMFDLCPFGGQQCQEEAVQQGPCHNFLESCLKN